MKMPPAGGGPDRTRLGSTPAMERSEAAEDRASPEGHGAFEWFVGRGQRAVSGPPFFVICVCVVVAWLVSKPIWHDGAEWQAVIHTVASVLTLLLIVLRENASRRADETAQEKLNVVAEGLAALMESHGRQDPTVAEAAEKLRQAVGLEKRH